MPGPIVVDRVSERRYTPFDAAGLALIIASSRAMALATRLSCGKDFRPTCTCTLPALSTRNSTLPALTSRTARATSNVTVPIFGLGMSPRGPSTLPSRPTWPMRSGVAIVESKSMKPPWIFSTRSSAPTTSAPASRASRSFSPLANTATRTVLPMPWGSTMAPRTIWSACLGSTPSRSDRSTLSSNFAAGACLTISIASSTEYVFVRSISVSVAFIRFVITGMSGSPFRTFHLVSPPPRLISPLHDVDAHAAGRAFDRAHGGFDRIRVEVHQLGLGDLANLGARDLADLVLVRHGRSLGDAGGPLEGHRRRWRLHHEGEGSVLVDRHHHGQDQSLLRPRLGIEALAELHDIDAVLTEGGAHRRRRGGLAGRGLQLHHRLDFFRHGSEPLHLVVLELHRRHSPEDRHHHLELPALRVEVVDRALEVHERSLDDPHLVPLLEGGLELGLLGTLFHLLENALDFLRGQGHRLVAAPDESRQLRRRSR